MCVAWPRKRSSILTVPSAPPAARYVPVGSVRQTCTGASCARAITRVGCTGDAVAVVGKSYILNAFDAENTQSVRPSGVKQSECMAEVSCSLIQYARTQRSMTWLTPAKRHICVSSFRSVRIASSVRVVTSHRPSCDSATGPPVYNGPTVRAFLNLKD